MKRRTNPLDQSHMKRRTDPLDQSLIKKTDPLDRSHMKRRTDPLDQSNMKKKTDPLDRLNMKRRTNPLDQSQYGEKKTDPLDRLNVEKGEQNSLRSVRYVKRKIAWIGRIWRGKTFYVDPFCGVKLILIFVKVPGQFYHLEIKIV